MNFFFIFKYQQRSVILIVQLVVVNSTSITEISRRPHRHRRFTASNDAAAIAVCGVKFGKRRNTASMAYSEVARPKGGKSGAPNEKITITTE
jgi:hypothetical protein